MQILILSHRVPYPPNKGEKIRTFHQIQYLAERGHTLSVCAPVESDEDIQHLEALQQRYVKHVGCAAKPGPAALALGLLRGQALSVANFYTHALQTKLDELLASQACDAIICTSSSMSEYVFRSRSLGAAATRPVLVMDFMDLDSDKWRQYQKLSRFPLSLIYAREARKIAERERRIHEAFDACLFISQSEVDLFLATTGASDKIHVVANGLDTSMFRPAPHPKPERGPVMLFTGVMDYRPNEDAVVWFIESAWSAIKSRHPDASFYIAGMNPSPKVSALSRHPGVFVTGFVDDIVEYYDRAHIFIAPFRIARGVQNKVLQAFACGLPTVTTPLGCEGIPCHDGEQVLVAESIDEFIARIDWIVANPASAARIGDNAAALIQREFSWSGKLAALEGILAKRHEQRLGE